MNIKQLSLALSVAAGVALSTSALAQQAPLAPADITFNGNILGLVCTPALGGSSTSGTIVTLPDATTGQLATIGDTANETEFTITVTCPTALDGGVTRFWAHFEGGSVNPDGRFVATTGSNNVSFQLKDALGGPVVKAGGAAATTGPGANQGTGSTLFNSSSLPMSATKTYAVEYYAEAGLTSADAGAVSADGTYTVYFY